MKKIIIILIIIGFLSPFFSLAQVAPPKTMEETKEMGEKALEIGERRLPGIIRQIWENEVLPIWLSMWNWLRTKTLPKIEGWIMPEYEKRKEYFEKGLEQEKKEIKEELKTEAPKTDRSLWERFKELIR